MVSDEGIGKYYQDKRRKAENLRALIATRERLISTCERELEVHRLVIQNLKEQLERALYVGD